MKVNGNISIPKCHNWDIIDYCVNYMSMLIEIEYKKIKKIDMHSEGVKWNLAPYSMHCFDRRLKYHV